MPNKVLLSPLIARLSGTMSHPNSALVLRYTGVGKAALITPKSRGGPETKTKIWQQTQWIWNYLDGYWSNLPQQTRNLWTRHAHNSKAKGRSGFGYFRSVNIMRLLFWYPVLPKPPNTCDSIKRSCVQSAEFPGLFPGVVKRVWYQGVMYPKDDPIEFDPENPPDPGLPVPPPPGPDPAPPPQPPWPPCYPLTDYTVTSSSGPNGDMIPEGVHTYKVGANPGFFSLPDCGYLTDYFLIDGTPRYGIAQWHFNHIHKDHTIHAEFFPTAYYLVADEFERENDSPLGPCWTNFLSEPLDMVIWDQNARLTYWVPGGGFQSSYASYHRAAADTSQFATCKWSGTDHLTGTDRVQAYCKLSLGWTKYDETGDYYWAVFVSSSLPNDSLISFYRFQAGVGTLLATVRDLPTVTGVLLFELYQLGPLEWRLRAFLDGTLKLLHTDSGTGMDPGTYNAFQLRMRPSPGVITGGWTEIEYWQIGVQE